MLDGRKREVKALLKVLESKDVEHLGHYERVVELTLVIAEKNESIRETENQLKVCSNFTQCGQNFHLGIA